MKGGPGPRTAPASFRGPGLPAATPAAPPSGRPRPGRALPGGEPSAARGYAPVNRGGAHAGVGRVGVRAVNVVPGVLASCRTLHNELSIDDLPSFDVTVDLRHVWGYKMRSKGQVVVYQLHRR